MAILRIILGGILAIGASSLPVMAASSLQEATLEHLGIERSYVYHLPEDYISKGRMPAIIALHGGLGSGRQAAKRWGFNRLSDKEGFIVVYPDGLHRQWNDGRGTNFSSSEEEDDEMEETDDVGFLSALIKHIVKNYNADPKRIYLVGASNGGMMALRIGCEKADKIAGVAAIIANIPEAIYDQCKPARPIPMMLMNGTDDTIVPYDGGSVSINGKEYGMVVSTDETLALWTENNKCGEDADIIEIKDSDSDDDTTATLKHFINCEKGADVELYRIEGGGHMIPGLKAPAASLYFGKSSRDLKAANVIWEFFAKQYEDAKKEE